MKKRYEGNKEGKLISRIKSKVNLFFGNRGSEDFNHETMPEEDYLELDTSHSERRGKVIVRPFVLNDFSDVRIILDQLREGSTIALINISPLRNKDIIELKRAINKLKKTTDAIEGDIAGFGDEYIIVTPSFAQVYRARGSESKPVESIES